MFRRRRGWMLASMSSTDWTEAMPELLPTGTVTLLLADVEGSTRLWNLQPVEMASAVAQLDRTVSDVVAAHGGVRPVEQGEGDSFVVAFTRATDAVACALALQRAPLAPIRLRIGMHSGEVHLRDEGNYIGPTVNRTARIRDLAHGGQTVMSSVTEELVADTLPAGAWVIDLGTHQLRDLPRPAHIVQLCHPELDNEFPPLRTHESGGANNLPVQLTSFVGRGAQLDEVRKLLSDNRLVTLTGAGGAGKTRLALQVADRVKDEFTDGLCYVDLATVVHAEVVPVTLARALGLPDQPGRSTVDTVLRFLAGRQILLILDNCEHLLEACASLATEVLGACPALRLVATSREPIAVAGEVTYLVPSLSLADEAIELFSDRARLVQPNFRVTEQNVATVVQICLRLDGMPLAIELAAARVRALSLDDILGSLQDRFRLLTGGSRTAVRRQQTLRASVDWSHALLTEPERILFRRLAVFMGGFDVEAAQAVAGASEVERFQLLDELTLLVDKSLVIAENASGRTRYRLLETMRQYAMEKLGESGESDAVRGRHRDYYTAMADVLDTPHDRGHEQRVERVELEIDNLRSAFVWCLENSDVEAGLRIASSLQPVWLTRGRVQEGLDWLDAGLRAYGEGRTDMPAAVVRAMAESTLLAAVAVDGRNEAEVALGHARQLGDPVLLIRALTAQGAMSAFRAEAATSYFEEAADIAREIGDAWRLCQTLAWRSTVATVTGDAAAINAVVEEGLGLADDIGDRFTSRQLRWTLASLEVHQGKLASALSRCRDVVAEADAAHDLVCRVIATATEGFVLAFEGNTDRGRAAAAAILTDAVDLGEVYEGTGLDLTGLVCLAAGDAAGAWEAFKAARQRAVWQDWSKGVYHAFTALAALACGDLAAARRWSDEANSTMHGWHYPTARVVSARIAIADNDADRAERDLHAALATAAEVGAYLFVPDALEGLGYLAIDAERYADGVRLFGAADAARLRMGAVRLKVFDVDHTARLASARVALDEDDFDAVWAEGAALSIEEAIAYARRGRGERKRPSSGWESLTPAELDVVRLLSQGLSNKDIAEHLFVSPRTVQAHLSHAYSKLGLSSRLQLAQEASRHG